MISRARIADSRVRQPDDVRILVVRNRFVGDTVLSIPFLRNLRRQFPRAVIDVMVERGSGDVLVDCPYINELLTWQRPSARRRRPLDAISNLFTTARWLKARRYDRAYVLKRSFSSAVVVALAGIPHRVGFASDWRRLLLTRSVPIREGRHEARLFLDLLEIDGGTIDDGFNENWVAQDVARKVDALLPPKNGPRLFAAPCSTNPSKQWPLDRFAAVISAAVNGMNADVFFCGGPADIATHARLVELVGPRVASRVHDFSTQLSLREAGGLLDRMDVCLGIDTGLMHLAASYGVPVVALFGPMDPGRWGPWRSPHEVIRSGRTCSPCGLRVPCPIEGACMKDIDIRDVVEAIGRLLAVKTCSGSLPGTAAATVPPAAASCPALRTIDLTCGGGGNGGPVEIQITDPGRQGEPASSCAH